MIIRANPSPTLPTGLNKTFKAMTLQSTKLEIIISPLQEAKDMRYIYSMLDHLRTKVNPRHTELARLLDNAVELSAGLSAAAQDYVDQNR